MMDTDDEEGEKTKPNGLMLNAAVRRAITEGAVFTYFSLTRLLAAMHPADVRDTLRDGIARDFATLGRPVPTDEPWHLAYVQIDGVPDGTWRISTRPDLVLPGYVVAMMSDQDRYARAQQNCRELVAKKRQQAPLN